MSHSRTQGSQPSQLSLFSDGLNNLLQHLPSLRRTSSKRTPEVIDIQVRDIRNLILAIKSSSCELRDKTSSLFEIHDTIFTIARIEDILESYLLDKTADAWKIKTQQFLTRRADNILNGPLCYTLNTDYLTNHLCIALARLCDPTHINTLLMPKVSADDIYGNNIDELTIGQFILADDQHSFISLVDIVDTVFNRSVEAEDHSYLTTTAEGQSRNLTTTEMLRLGNIHQKLEEISSTIKNPSLFSQLMNRNSNRLLSELITLRNGLRDGDAGHHGEEMNAGADANQAIVRFRQYFEKLSIEKQNMIRAISCGNITIGESVLDIIFRDPAEASRNAGTGVNYCMAIVGGQLERIVNQNLRTLRGISDSKEELIKQLKENLLLAIQERTTIIPGGITHSELGTQLVNLSQDIYSQLAMHTKNTDASAILIELARFVFSECERRIKSGSFDEKLNCYANILFAIGMEAIHFDARKPEDNSFVLNETFRRITLLASTSTAYIALKTPHSQNHWNEFIAASPLLQNYPFMINGVTELKYVNDYVKLFPLNGQRNIISTERQAQRDNDRDEKIAAQRAEIEMEAWQQQRKTSVFGMFYQKPEASKQNSAPCCGLVTKKTVAVATVATAVLAYQLLM